MPYCDIDQDWLNFGSSNDLLPDGTKPLPKPIMTSHRRCSVAFTREQFHELNPSLVFGNYTSKITTTNPRGQWVNIGNHIMQWLFNYCQTPNIRHTLLAGIKLVDHSDVVGASHRLLALLQLHLHSQVNTWLQLFGQRQLQDETRNFLEFSAPLLEVLWYNASWD